MYRVSMYVKYVVKCKLSHNHVLHLIPLANTSFWYKHQVI